MKKDLRGLNWIKLSNGAGFYMWETKLFDKLKDAREFANNLPLSPIGGVRPFMIERYEYTQSKVYGDIVKIREMKV